MLVNWDNDIPKIWKIKLLYFELSTPWHLYVLLLANLLAFYLTYLLAFYLAYLLTLYLAYHLAFYLAYFLLYVLAYLLALYLAYLLAYLLAFYLAYLLAFYLAYLLQHVLAYLLAFFLTFYLAFYLAYFCHSIWPLRSSGAHWAQRVPGWGPAVLTELGRSQVEVQRCSLSSDGPRLRSSSAHWARKVPGWGPAVPSALRPLQLRSSSAHCARKLAKRLAKSWQGGSGRGSWYRHGRGETGGGGRGGGGGGGRTALIKSNNPHLAGGEFMFQTTNQIIINITIIYPIHNLPSGRQPIDPTVST